MRHAEFDSSGHSTPNQTYLDFTKTIRALNFPPKDVYNMKFKVQIMGANFYDFDNTIKTIDGSVHGNCQVENKSYYSIWKRKKSTDQYFIINENGRHAKVYPLYFQCQSCKLTSQMIPTLTPRSIRDYHKLPALIR